MYSRGPGVRVAPSLAVLAMLMCTIGSRNMQWVQKLDIFLRFIDYLVASSLVVKSLGWA